MRIRDLFKYLMCKHEFIHRRNIYGDEINRFFPIKRSEWICTKCGRFEYSDELHKEEGK